MTDRIAIKMPAENVDSFMKSLDGWIVDANRLAIEPVRDKVIDLTPRLTGGLQGRVLVREEDGGRQQVVFGTGVVMNVHENNGFWTFRPPYRAIRQWVEVKLGISGPQGDRVAFAIREKIYRRGLTLPNREGKGKMFQRTYEFMVRSNLWYRAFRSALKRMMGA